MNGSKGSRPVNGSKGSKHKWLKGFKDKWLKGLKGPAVEAEGAARFLEEEPCSTLTRQRESSLFTTYWSESTLSS